MADNQQRQCLKEAVFWYSRSYGSRVNISRSKIIAASAVFCIITPATNWAIPFLKRLIKRDLNIRYEHLPIIEDLPYLARKLAKKLAGEVV